jgi:predicted DNA-binding ribbon-helix-helix protein
LKLNKKQIDAGALALNQATNPPAPRRSRGRQVKTHNGIKLVRTSVQLEQWHVDAIALIAKDKNIPEAQVLRELLDDNDILLEAIGRNKPNN